MPIPTPTPPGPPAGAGAGVAAPAEPTRRTKVLRASAWRVGSYAVTNVIRLVSNIILAKLLAPDAFGLVAMAGVIVTGLQMFSEVGIGPAIVQSKRGEDPKFLNTAWTMQSIRGGALWLIACALAAPVASFYEEPALFWLIPAVGLSTLINGFNSTSIFTLNRQLLEGRRSLLDLGQNIITRSVMIGWALMWPSPWALVGGTVVGTLCFTISSHILLPGSRNKFQWDRESASALFRFGIWIFIGTVIAFFGQQVDKLLLGKLEMMTLMGVYAISLTIARMPREATGVLAGHVLYPLLASYARESPEQLHAKLLDARKILLSAALVSTLGVILVSPWFFGTLYDERWAAAAWMAPLTAISVWISILTATSDRALLAVGHPRPLAFSGLATVVLTSAGCLVGHLYFGVAGFILGLAAGALGGHIVVVFAMAARGMPIHKQDGAYTLLLAALAAAGVGGPALVGRHFGAEAADWTAIGVGGALLAGVGLWAVRRVAPMVIRR